MFQPESTGNFKQTFFELEMVHAGDEFGTALALHQAGPPCLGWDMSHQKSNSPNKRDRRPGLPEQNEERT